MGYYDDKEFESKVGQLLYNMIIYERLKEYVMERVRGKERSSIRIDLGEDRGGHRVVLDILISKVEDKKKRIEVPEGEPSPAVRKGASVILTSEKAAHVSDIEIARAFEQVLSGRREMEDWRIDEVVVCDGPISTLVELPIEQIVIAEGKREVLPTMMVERLSRSLELLPPVCVRPIGGSQGMYELVYGYHQLMVYKTAGRNTIPAIVRRIGDEEANKLFTENSQLWKKQPSLVI